MYFFHRRPISIYFLSLCVPGRISHLFDCLSAFFASDLCAAVSGYSLTNSSWSHSERLSQYGRMYFFHRRRVSSYCFLPLALGSGSLLFDLSIIFFFRVPSNDLTKLDILF